MSANICVMHIVSANSGIIHPVVPASSVTFIFPISLPFVFGFLLPDTSYNIAIELLVALNWLLNGSCVAFGLYAAKTDITLSKLKIIADVLGVEPKDLLDFK